MPEAFTTFLNRALAQGSRSTVLKSLGWLVALTSTATIAAYKFDSPGWLGLMYGLISGFAMILYLIAFIYFGITDKDSLRSEKYSIQKLAIQKGLIGDDLTGFKKIGNTIDVDSESLKEKGKDEG